MQVQTLYLMLTSWDNVDGGGDMGVVDVQRPQALCKPR